MTSEFRIGSIIYTTDYNIHCVCVYTAIMVLRLLCVLGCIVLLPRKYQLHFYF